MRIFDVVSLDDNNMLVVGVSSDIDPQANKWSQTINGEWFGVAPTVTQTEGTGNDTGGGLERNNSTGTGSITVGGQTFDYSGRRASTPNTGSITTGGQTYIHSNGTTKAVM